MVRSAVFMVALAFAACDSTRDARPPAEAESPPAARAPAQPATSPSAELSAALHELLRGPTEPPNDSNSHGWFSSRTANALRSATIDSAGHAIVDFTNLQAIIPNASSSAGSTLLLKQLNHAVFGIAAVQSVEYRMEGSCARFWEWLQYGCHTVTRDSL